MPIANIKTFYCAMCFRDLLDGARPTRFAEEAFLCVDDERILRIFDGQGLSYWVFITDPLPQEPLFMIDLKATACSFDFRRVASANGNHMFGRMRITGDFGSGVERLIFKFSVNEYNKIGPLIRSFVSTAHGGRK